MTRLLAGAEGSLQKELHLENISSEDNNPFVSLSQKLEERSKAAAEFVKVSTAFEMLNIDPSAVRGIWHILAAIYHLGVAGVTKGMFFFVICVRIFSSFISSWEQFDCCVLSKSY